MSALMWWLLGTVGGAIVSAEVSSWFGPAQRAMIRLVGTTMPPRLRERYVEEWQAELENMPRGPVTRLAYTGSLLVRAWRITREVPTKSDDSQAAELIRQLGAFMDKHDWPVEGPELVRSITVDEDVDLYSGRAVFIDFETAGSDDLIDIHVSACNMDAQPPLDSQARQQSARLARQAGVHRTWIGTHLRRLM